MAPPSRDPLRTFVALVPSDATTSGLAAEAERIVRADPAAHPVARGNLHLTLAFLGATAADAVPSIVKAIEAGVAGLAPVRFRPVGLSAFPSPRSPRVVFADLAPDTHRPLEVLAMRVAEALAAVGHGPDRAERFHPHVTLARRGRTPGGSSFVLGSGWGESSPGGARRSDGRAERPTAALEKLLTEGALQGTYIDDVVTDVHLLSSEPAPGAPSGGRIYRVLASIPLGPHPTDATGLHQTGLDSTPIGASRAGVSPSASPMSSARAERP